MYEEARVFIAEHGGERLDFFLASALEGYSRSHLQKLIASGAVLVRGRSEKPSYRVQEQDEIRVEIPIPEELKIAAEKIALDIIYEDEDLIVVNKARGMVVHPAAGVATGTLVNALLSHCKDLSGINGVLRPGIVHRLDKDTSGVMVVAKNDAAHIDLAEQIQKKTARRKYLAIVCGNIKEPSGVIEGNIARHPTDRKRMAVTAKGGKRAVTEFTVRERFGEYTLVECALQTGRTHQIRVHMTKIGHPVLGDPKYGKQKKSWGILGQALHSTELQFCHPRMKEEMKFHAELPLDMAEILTKLRKRNA